MSVQRWTFDGPPAYEYENGGYVTYADHVAALELLHGVIRFEQARAESARTDALHGVRDAVAALIEDEGWAGTEWAEDILAVIKKQGGAPVEYVTHADHVAAVEAAGEVWHLAVENLLARALRAEAALGEIAAFVSKTRGDNNS